MTFYQIAADGERQKPVELAKTKIKCACGSGMFIQGLSLDLLNVPTELQEASGGAIKSGIIAVNAGYVCSSCGIQLQAAVIGDQIKIMS